MALTDSLVSYWKLDEASGNALDAHGSNDLTDNNTVGSGTGKINNARDFEADNSEYFSHAHNSDFSVAGGISFTWAAWINAENLDTTQTVLCKYDNTFEGSDYVLWYVSGIAKFQWIVYDGVGGQTDMTDDGHFGPSTGTWYHIVAWYDADVDEIGIAINAEAAWTAAASSGPAGTSSAFNMGRLVDIGFDWDGRIDEVGFWKRVLTSTERTQLYNGGAGLAYPFSAAAASLLPVRPVRRLNHILVR